MKMMVSKYSLFSVPEDHAEVQRAAFRDFRRGIQCGWLNVPRVRSEVFK